MFLLIHYDNNEVICLDKNSVGKLFAMIESSKDIISKEAYSEIYHFYEHAEYEMAFEGLIIELVQENKYPNDFSKAEWEALGIEFVLKENSVFDHDIWGKFIKWMTNYR